MRLLGRVGRHNAQHAERQRHALRVAAIGGGEGFQEISNRGPAFISATSGDDEAQVMRKSGEGVPTIGR